MSACDHIYVLVTIMHARFMYRSFSLFRFTRITFPTSNTADRGKKRKADEEEEDKTLTVEPYVTPNRGPYPYNQPKR